MARVTSKLQVTVPKVIAVQYGIQPGDDLDWTPAGSAVRVEKVDRYSRARTAQAIASRLAVFDAATVRQAERQGSMTRSRDRDRGWKREDLYERGSAR